MYRDYLFVVCGFVLSYNMHTHSLSHPPTYSLSSLSLSLRGDIGETHLVAPFMDDDGDEERFKSVVDTGRWRMLKVQSVGLKILETSKLCVDRSCIFVYFYTFSKIFFSIIYFYLLLTDDLPSPPPPSSHCTDR